MELMVVVARKPTPVSRGMVIATMINNVLEVWCVGDTTVEEKLHSTMQMIVVCGQVYNSPTNSLSHELSSSGP